jgi:hypothetical protein
VDEEDFYSTPGLTVNQSGGISSEGTTGKIEGFAGVNRYLLAFSKKQAKKHERAVMAVGQFLLLLSREIVPVETGALFKSGKVTKKGSGWKTESIVSYSTPYAVYVHEDLDKAHGAAYNAKNNFSEKESSSWNIFKRGRILKSATALAKDHPRRPQEQAKFLEQPARENRSAFKQLYIREMKRQ